MLYARCNCVVPRFLRYKHPKLASLRKTTTTEKINNSLWHTAAAVCHIAMAMCVFAVLMSVGEWWVRVQAAAHRATCSATPNPLIFSIYTAALLQGSCRTAPPVVVDRGHHTSVLQQHIRTSTNATRHVAPAYHATTHELNGWLPCWWHIHLGAPLPTVAQCHIQGGRCQLQIARLLQLVDCILDDLV